ncbi:stage VI sporulation protein F [Haloplasma contractile]|uniref:Sporulation-specific transcription factor SpoVIF protein n=1 Tax=Haloplasma contractile SSD-17B TaxID=1033810 RepID=F7PVN3_9MOLU|nr:stage VI sporulation protein F [Haloplasma contractile]ERJ12798.1 Sporulation-specific transcription factor SpoVIF protein [Haloplasma contractile SSD-17B]
MGLNRIFDEINSKASVDKESIFKIADSIKNANLKDEKVLRQLIRDVSKIANKNVPKELEDKLVEQIKQDGVPKNIGDLF